MERDRGCCGATVNELGELRMQRELLNAQVKGRHSPPPLPPPPPVSVSRSSVRN